MNNLILPNASGVLLMCELHLNYVELWIDVLTLEVRQKNQHLPTCIAEREKVRSHAQQQL